MASWFRRGPDLEHGGRRGILQPAIGHALALALLLAPVLALAKAPPRTVLVFGDSLSAAHGLRVEQGWVALLDEKVAREMPGWHVANASISGETTAGGASRIIDELVRVRPAVVVIELGANDGLRGLQLQQTRINLARMIGAAHGAGARVLLVGMRLPPNFGPQYTREFESNYSDLARRFDVALLPFLLAPIATDRASFQADNLHPVAAAQPRLRDHVWTALAPLLH
jgi:acyl-CoA thioesterase-1